MSEKIYDLIIIGAGPAGYTAALYASRASLKVLCFEGWQPGGQLTTTTIVENFPGFENGVDGNRLMKEMRAQAGRFGTEYMTTDITKADFAHKPFRVYADRGYQGRAVIIATGARPRMLGIPSEKKLWGKGVSACATCDGFFFRGKTVAVIGGGDSAMEEANFLTKFAAKVYLVHRRNEFRAGKILVERTKNNPKIELVLSKIAKEILGEDQVIGIRLKDAKTNTLSELKLNGVFLAIGHVPSTQLFAGQMEMNENGYLLQKTNTMTNVPGVFAAGDCVDHRYRQAITAAGDGCRAAIDATRWLEGSL